MRFRRKSVLLVGLAVFGLAIVFPAVMAAAGPRAAFVTQHPLTAATFHAATAPSTTKGSGEYGGGAAARCFGIYPATGASSYQDDCYGHDEPAIDPISNTPGSGQDITWRFQLPSSAGAKHSLLDMGPTFWVGATLSDSSSLANSVFSELQFYPDSSLAPQSGNDINTACTKFGFDVNPDPGTWSICDFAWGLYNTPDGFEETPAYVGVVDQGNSGQPLYLHSGDTITVHIFPSGDSNNDAEQVITDVTRHQTGSLIMYSDSTTGAGSAVNPSTGDGPLTLPYSTNTTDNAMPWGVVDGTPFAFSWEIGHSNIYTHSFQGECVPGQWDCQSYDVSDQGWDGVKPFRLLSVTFGINGQNVQPDSWATNDSQGGSAEDELWCGGFGNSTGTSTCNFPYYTYNKGSKSVDLGGSYPGTTNDYGQARAEYATDPECPGPLTGEFGFLYFCDTTLSPSPNIP